MATKRVADMTPEEVEKQRERSRLNQRKRRANRTEDERIEENKKNNQRMKEYLSNMSSEEKEEYNKHRRELRNARIAKMTPEELAEMKRKKSEKARQYRLSLTDEQKEKIRERDRLLHKKYRKNATLEMIQKQKEWRMKNADRIRENQKTWRQKNKDKIKMYKHKSYIKNKEHIKRYMKEYNKNNEDKLKQYRHEYYMKNRDRISERNKKYRNKNIDKYKVKQKAYLNCERNIYEKYAGKLLPEDGAICDDNGFIMVKCFHTGKMFYPKRYMLLNRIRSINKFNAGENHFYISEEAKKACPVYHTNPNWDPYRKEKQHLIPPIDPFWRKTVIERANGHCERCGKASDVLHAHHIIPKGVCGMLEEDFDNGIALCPECHLGEGGVHDIDGCRLHELAAEKRETV